MWSKFPRNSKTLRKKKTFGMKRIQEHFSNNDTSTNKRQIQSNQFNPT